MKKVDLRRTNVFKTCYFLKQKIFTHAILPETQTKKKIVKNKNPLENGRILSKTAVFEVPDSSSEVPEVPAEPKVQKWSKTAQNS